MKDNDKELIT